MSIIPKPIKTEKVSFGINILLYCSVAALLILGISYFILERFEKNLELTIHNLKEELVLVRERTPAETDMEKRVFLTDKRINDFSILVEDRVSAINFFGFFEGLVHPQVWFTGIELDLMVAQATVSGQAESFFVLEQQLMIFREELLIKETKLIGSEVGEEGGVGFEIKLFFHPKVFAIL